MNIQAEMNVQIALAARNLAQKRLGTYKMNMAARRNRAQALWSFRQVQRGPRPTGDTPGARQLGERLQAEFDRAQAAFSAAVRAASEAPHG